MKLIKTLGIIFCYATFFGQDNTILKIDDQTVNKTEFEQRNSQAALCHSESDDPYACEDMLDTHDFPITKDYDILPWTHFRRTYDSLDQKMDDETR